MNRSTLLSACLAASLLACTERTPPAAPAAAPVSPPARASTGASEDAGAPPAKASLGTVEDAGAQPPQAAAPDSGTPDAGTVAEQPASSDAGSARCSAASLSPETTPEGTPPPRAVESMRRRIIAAALACDYTTLSALGDEKGKGVAFSFGGGEDAAAHWRTLEAGGEPVLARMVRVLRLPHVKDGDLYVWPAVHITGLDSEADWKAVEGLYSAQELKTMRELGSGYLGMRLAISSRGDWQYAIEGD